MNFKRPSIKPLSIEPKRVHRVRGCGCRGTRSRVIGSALRCCPYNHASFGPHLGTRLGVDPVTTRIGVGRMGGCAGPPTITVLLASIAAERPLDRAVDRTDPTGRHPARDGLLERDADWGEVGRCRQGMDHVPDIPGGGDGVQEQEHGACRRPAPDVEGSFRRTEDYSAPVARCPLDRPCGVGRD